MGPCARSFCMGTLIGALCGTWPATCGAQGDAVEATDTILRQPADEETAEVRFLRALEKKVDVDFRATPLVNVARFVEENCHLPVVVDRHSLAEIGIAAEKPVSFAARNIKLGTALKWMLKPLGLTWIVDDDFVLITTINTAGNAIEVRVYDVHDLLDWDARMQRQPGFHDPGTDGHDYDTLIEVITSQITPSTWPDGTRPAPIRVFAGTLVIAQAQHVHRRIDDLLNKLRKVRAQRRKTSPPQATLDAPRKEWQ